MIRRAVVVVSIALVSCRLSEDPAGRSAAVVLADGATGVHYTTIEERESIAYEVSLPYPATPLVERIADALEAAGYTRVDAPGAFRWTEYEGQENRVDHWNGTWRSADGGKTAQYILEYRGRRDRLHVWARVGAPDAEQQQTSTELPPEDDAPDEAIELAESEAAVLCGAEGTGVLAFRATAARAAEVRWRFHLVRGSGDEGMNRVEERPGAKPGEIDARNTHFTVGPWDLTWSPGSVTVESQSRTLDQALDGRVTNATSWLYYPSGVRVRKIEAAKMPLLDLQTTCR